MGYDPTPAKVTFMDMDMYGVSKPGWYLFNDNHRAVDGPFASRKDAVASLGSPTKKKPSKSKAKKKTTSKTKTKRR